MLELSLRLRKAVMVLGQYPLHQADGYCLLNEKLAEFDVLTTYVAIDFSIQGLEEIESN